MLIIMMMIIMMMMMMMMIIMMMMMKTITQTIFKLGGPSSKTIFQKVTNYLTDRQTCGLIYIDLSPSSAWIG